MARVLSGLKYLTGKDVAGRNLRCRPDDTFIVSYPKSGNTWLRFLVANLLYPQSPVTLLDADRLVPSVDGRSRKFFQRMVGPRMIKSHYPFEPAYERIIYIVRDPRDVAVSQFHYQVKRRVLDESHPIEDFVARFVAGKVCPYGSWGENVGSWMAARRHHSGFLWLRYEDLHLRTEMELLRIASHLNVEPTRELLAQTTARSSADRMRTLEREQAGEWASTKGTRSDRLFVREASAGGWKNQLPESSVAAIESAWAPLMRFLHYELAIHPQKAHPATRFFEGALPRPAL